MGIAGDRIGHSVAGRKFVQAKCGCGSCRRCEPVLRTGGNLVLAGCEVDKRIHAVWEKPVW
jgi:hypothetical protein